MIKNKKSEVDEFIEILEKHGFTEITPEERKSDEFRESIERTRKYVLEREKKNKKVIKK